MGGNVVSGYEDYEGSPSSFYGGHFRPGKRLDQLAAGFIDGHYVTLDDELPATYDAGGISIIVRRVTKTWIRVALIEGGRHGTLAYIIDLEPNVNGTDVRGQPILPDDLHDNAEWQVYNCAVSLTPYYRDKLLNDEWPKDT